MKCDDVLASLETGIIWKWLVARVHVARCRRCQKEVQALVEFKRSLAHTEPLTEADRRRLRVISESSSESQPRLAPIFAFAGLVAAIVLSAVIGLKFGRHEDPTRSIVQGPDWSDSDVSAVAISGDLIYRELADVRTGLGDLSQEIAELSAAIELLDEQRAMDDVLTQFAINEKD